MSVNKKRLNENFSRMRITKEEPSAMNDFIEKIPADEKEGGLIEEIANKESKEALPAKMTVETVQYEKEEIVQLPLDKIRPNPFQPRQDFNKKELEGLAESIEAKGVLQPVAVRKTITDDAEWYELIFGGRRCEASKIARKTEIPAIIRNVTDADMKLLAFLEDDHRKDLNPFEKMQAIASIRPQFEDEASIAKVLGKNERTVRRYIKIHAEYSKLPEKIREGIKKEAPKLDWETLKALSEIADHIMKKVKSDNREMVRFCSQLKEKGVKHVILKIYKKLHPKSAEPEHEIKENFMFYETGLDYVAKFRWPKKIVISPEDTEKLKTAMKQFVDAVSSIKQSVKPEKEAVDKEDIEDEE